MTTRSPGSSGASNSGDGREVLARFEAELDLVDLVARQVSRRLATSIVTVDDLRSFGREGLLHAARSFDASRGVPFRRWANLRIRGAMIDGVRRWGYLPRRVYHELRAISDADAVQEAFDEEDAANPAAGAGAADARLKQHLATLATAMAMGAAAPVPAREEIDSDEETPSPEEVVAQAELVARVRAAVAKLPDSERKLVEGHYFGEQTLDQASASLGLSKSWGSRLHARAIERIARELKE